MYQFVKQSAPDLTFKFNLTHRQQYFTFTLQGKYSFLKYYKFFLVIMNYSTSRKQKVHPTPFLGHRYTENYLSPFTVSWKMLQIYQVLFQKSMFIRLFLTLSRLYSKFLIKYTYSPYFCEFSMYGFGPVYYCPTLETQHKLQSSEGNVMAYK